MQQAGRGADRRRRPAGTDPSPDSPSASPPRGAPTSSARCSERRGADVLHAPALRIVPLADDSELLAATKELIEHAPDIVVATTAIGFRGWVEAAEAGASARICCAGCGGVELLARGPKVKGAIRAAGLTEEWSPASESMAEVLDRLLARGRRQAAASHCSCTASRCPGSSSRCGPAGRRGRRRAGLPVDGRRRTSLRSTGCSTRPSPAAWTR